MRGRERERERESYHLTVAINCLRLLHFPEIVDLSDGNFQHIKCIFIEMGNIYKVMSVSSSLSYLLQAYTYIHKELV